MIKVITGIQSSPGGFRNFLKEMLTSKEMSAPRTGEWGPKKEGNFKSRHSVWKGMKMWKDTRGERRTDEYSVTSTGSARWAARTWLMRFTGASSEITLPLCAGSWTSSWGKGLPRRASWSGLHFRRSVLTVMWRGPFKTPDCSRGDCSHKSERWWGSQLGMSGRCVTFTCSSPSCD